MLIEQALAKTARRPDPRSGALRTDSAADARARTRIRILVLDERGIMRDGLCALLALMPEVEIVGNASASLEALRGAVGLRVDVVIMDFPEGGSAKLIAAFKTEIPDVRVIVLTLHKEDHLIEAALRAGADGYVLKTDSREELFTAVTSVATGKSFISPSLYGRVVRGYTTPPRSTPRPQNTPSADDLTDRERQVMRLIAAGHRTREIAQLLSLSHKTIEKHRTSLMRKLGLRNASSVAAYAIAHGFADG